MSGRGAEARSTGPEWRRLPERGSPAITRFYMRLCLALGRTPARPILFAIAAYFQLSSPVARRASRRYLARVLDRRPGRRDTFRHILTFASTIMDRVFFLSGRDDALKLNVYGAEHFDALRAEGRGFFLMSAHLGSFEAMRALGRGRGDLPIKILMYVDNAERLNAVLSDLNPQVMANVIPLGRPDAMLEVRDWIERGGIVGVLADRSTEGEKLTTVDFLGTPAAFPLGPWLLAATLQAPALLSFALYRGGGRYDVHFEPFADPVTAPRGERRTGAAAYARAYADRLAAYCRCAPFNWFNFYDFWGEAQPDPKRPERRRD
jgi:predicted LPLAT superfamily acyltransferase